MIIVASTGFASLFVGIELLSLPAFALIVHGQGRSVASEGAFKYLVLSSIASATFLFGVSLVLRADRHAGARRLVATRSSSAALQGKAAGLLVLAGLFMKAAVFPFHAWAPDAYAAARLPVTALMASLVKAAVILALARIVGTIAARRRRRRWSWPCSPSSRSCSATWRRSARRGSSACWPTRRWRTPAT